MSEHKFKIRTQPATKDYPETTIVACVNHDEAESFTPAQPADSGEDGEHWKWWLRREICEGDFDFTKIFEEIEYEGEKYADLSNEGADKLAEYFFGLFEMMQEQLAESESPATEPSTDDLKCTGCGTAIIDGKCALVEDGEPCPPHLENYLKPLATEASSLIDQARAFIHSPRTAPHIEEIAAKMVAEFAEKHAAQAIAADRFKREEKYDELIMAVVSKHLNESRHETALRYIRERENPSSSMAGSRQEATSEN